MIRFPFYTLNTYFNSQIIIGCCPELSHPLPVLSGRPPSDKAMVMVRAWSARTR